MANKELNQAIGRCVNYYGLSNYPGWEKVSPWEDHPNNRISGALVRNARTGVYMLFVNGQFDSVPQAWAIKVVSQTEKTKKKLVDFEYDESLRGKAVERKYPVIIKETGEHKVASVDVTNGTQWLMDFWDGGIDDTWSEEHQAYVLTEVEYLQVTGQYEYPKPPEEPSTKWEDHPWKDITEPY